MSLRLSILIPVYNALPFLRQCLDSVSAQTLKDFEAICINDGSTDDSLAILKEYAEKDPRFKILDKSNSGYGDSLNRAFKLAKGNYVGIVEPDDYLEPDMFEKLLTSAEKQSADIAKCSYYNYYGKTGKNVPEILFPPKFFARNRLKNFTPDYLLNPLENPAIFLVSPTVWSAIYRREMLEKNKIEFLPTLGASYQDIGFAFKTFASAEKIYFSNLPLYHYRRDNSNASSAKSSAKILAVKHEFDELDKYLANLNPAPDAVSKADVPENVFITSAYLCRFRSYLWNYNRLKFASALKFAKVAKKDYEKAVKNGFDLKSFDSLERAGESKFATKHPTAYIYLRPFYRFKNWLLVRLAKLYHALRKDKND